HRQPRALRGRRRERGGPAGGPGAGAGEGLRRRLAGRRRAQTRGCQGRAAPSRRAIASISTAVGTRVRLPAPNDSSTGKAGGIGNVSRSKRLSEPPEGGSCYRILS